MGGGATAKVRRAHACAVTRAVLAGLLAVLLTKSTAHAEPELRIDWSTPNDRPDCPDAAWANLRIAEQLGRPPRAEVVEGVEAQAKIESAAEGLRLTLRTDAGSAAGERVIASNDCRVLSDAAVLIITLAVAEVRDREQTQVPSVPAVPGPPPAAPPVEKTPTARPRFVVRADAVLDVGFLDRAGFGPALSFGLAQGIWRAELGGLWLVPRELAGASAADGSIRASLWAGRLTGCALWGGRVQGGPCLAAELGQARGEGHGSPTTERARSHTLWAAGALGARVSVGIVSELALVLQSELLLCVARPRFVTVDSESGAPSLVHEPSLAQLRASLGAELRF